MYKLNAHHAFRGANDHVPDDARACGSNPGEQEAQLPRRGADDRNDARRGSESDFPLEGAQDVHE
jgi:hypothetical protein